MRRLCALAVFAFGLAACPGNGKDFECDPTTNKPCFEGYVCYSVTKTCRKSCTSATDCLASESCEQDICMPGSGGDSAAGGDSAGGDPATGD